MVSFQDFEPNLGFVSLFIRGPRPQVGACRLAGVFIMAGYDLFDRFLQETTNRADGEKVLLFDCHKMKCVCISECGKELIAT